MLQLSGIGVDRCSSCSAGGMLRDQGQQGDQCYSSQVMVGRCSSCPAGGMLGDQEQPGEQCYSSQVRVGTVGVLATQLVEWYEIRNSRDISATALR